MRTGVLALIVFLVIIVLIGGFFFLQTQEETLSPAIGPIMDTSSVTETQNQAETQQEQTQSQPQTHSINIQDFDFKTKELTIKSGDTVVWTNRDSTQHTVTSDSGRELDSSYLSMESSYSHTFTNQGTFAYHCKPHPYMKGTIVVQ